MATAPVLLYDGVCGICNRGSSSSFGWTAAAPCDSHRSTASWPLRSSSATRRWSGRRLDGLRRGPGAADRAGVHPVGRGPARRRLPGLAVDPAAGGKGDTGSGCGTGCTTGSPGSATRSSASTTPARSHLRGSAHGFWSACLGDVMVSPLRPRVVQRVLGAQPPRRHPSSSTAKDICHGFTEHLHPR